MEHLQLSYILAAKFFCIWMMGRVHEFTRRLHRQEFWRKYQKYLEAR